MSLSRLLAILLLPIWLGQITACGTLAATDAGRGSNEFGFNDPAPTSDASISASIRRQLINDPMINASRITVTTRQGVVSLEGRVKDADLRDRIIALCRQTRGVMQVNARLELEQP